MIRVPPPSAPGWARTAYDWRYVFPTIAAVGFVIALVVVGTSPTVWLVFSLQWLFVSLACMLWAHRASRYWTTEFGYREDRDKAWRVASSMRSAPGLESLASDVWQALADASMEDLEHGRDPDYRGSRAFARVRREAADVIVAARERPERVRSIERTVELLRAVHRDLRERDSN